jgi:hypothetical protein
VFRRALIGTVAVGSARGRQRVYHALCAQRVGGELADLLGLHVAWFAYAVAIDGLDVDATGGRAAAMLAVAENHRGLVRIIGLGNVTTVGWTERGQIVRLVPFNLVHRHRECALGPSRRRCGQISQWLLVQRKRLEDLAGISVAEHLANGLSVGGVYDVAVKCDRARIVFVGERIGQGEDGVHRLGRDAPGEDRI